MVHCPIPWAVSSSLGADKLYFWPKHNIYAFFMILFGLFDSILKYCVLGNRKVRYSTSTYSLFRESKSTKCASQFQRARTWTWTDPPSKPWAHHESEDSGLRWVRIPAERGSGWGQSGSDVKCFVLVSDYSTQPSRCDKSQVRSSRQKWASFSLFSSFQYCWQ